jgi:NADH-quinone oxidoreductase subunit C
MISMLFDKITEKLSTLYSNAVVTNNEITLTVDREKLLNIAMSLKADDDFGFDMLVDVCGVDYLHYGIAEWETQSATSTGFERGRDTRRLDHADQAPSKVLQAAEMPALNTTSQARFAAVYHLLSLKKNHRLRLKVYVSEADCRVPSVISIWPSANWFERETYDLFGIIFDGHPDLRRILTDYGFIGHPFRKDFPQTGKLEVRYDAKAKRVIYEPVSIEPRVLEPKVIRDDNRYETGAN